MSAAPGMLVDWDIERRKWARLRAEVRVALAAGPADYVADADRFAEVGKVVAEDDHFSDAAKMVPAPIPAPVGGESIDSVMDAIAAQVNAAELPPPARLDKLAKPKTSAAPKAHLNIKASDIPSDMERLAQSWKKPNV